MAGVGGLYDPGFGKGAGPSSPLPALLDRCTGGGLWGEVVIRGQITTPGWVGLWGGVGVDVPALRRTRPRFSFSADVQQLDARAPQGVPSLAPRGRARLCGTPHNALNTRLPPLCPRTALLPAAPLY